MGVGVKHGSLSGSTVKVSSELWSFLFEILIKRLPIDFFTVYYAILAEKQTRLKLDWMYGILVHFEPL